MLNKKIRNLSLVSISLLFSIIFVFVMLSSSKNGIKVGKIEKIVEAEIYNLISEFNIHKKDKVKHTYKLWSANFSSGNIPTPDISDKHINIIWLGGNKSLNIAGIEKFDIVITSTPLLANTLKRININANYLQLGNYYFDEYKLMNNGHSFFAVIGNPPFIEDILKERNIEYRIYSLKDKDKIISDMHNFKAVFTIGTEIQEGSSDLHPLYFKLAEQGVPIATYWSWPKKEENINLFNDFISFYIEKDDLNILIDEIISKKSIIVERIKNAKKLVQDEYSMERNINRLYNILEKRSDTPLSIDNKSINIDLSVSVGHIASGDFWLAKDLFSKMSDQYNKSITFFNSLYKYKTEYNILFRGSILPNKSDLFGKYNLLYIIYPLFNQSNDFELVENMDVYVENIKNIRSKFDAIIVASDKLSKTLNNNGIKSYYVPQFTNLDRFYPDYIKELKSDVLFVGVNAFYRKAYKYLLNENIDVTIFGPNYDNGISKADYLDNRILRKYYSSAKIVLNDTRDGMKEYGFISNRIFDASACGALVISDYVKEIEDIYGDSIPMWKTGEELVELVRYYLDPKNEQERIEKAKKARDITLNNFTAENAAKKIQFIIDSIGNNKNEN